jgi:pimeloyl-ACP methyl ester carboxylesterase
MWANGFETLALCDASLRQLYQLTHGPRWRDTLQTITEELREAYVDAVAVSPTMLNHLRVRTLVLNGGLRSDERSAALEMSNGAVCVEAGVIPGAGHLANTDQPAIYNAIVEDFWRRVEAV